MSCEEAVELILNGKREVGALSYGWILPWNPDPTGERTSLLRQELSQRSYIKALFWDQATLYQPPRSEPEQEAFDRALAVMMDLYASAVGTTCAVAPAPAHAVLPPPITWGTRTPCTLRIRMSTLLARAHTRC